MPNLTVKLLFSLKIIELSDTIKILTTLFSQWANENPDKIEPLPASGSARQYYRITSPNHQVIGAYHADINENKAFFAFTNHFYEKKLPVPCLLAVAPDELHYLQEDLGAMHFLDYVTTHKHDENKLKEAYTQILEILIDFQVKGIDGLDLSLCYPRKEFDKQAIMWDLYYFKYNFLKIIGANFNEQKLEDDFNELADYLITAPNHYFMYRDFQSRNIMIHQNKFYFIDYQGGRLGALPYDVASLLFEAKTKIPYQLKEDLVDIYIQLINDKLGVSQSSFKQYYGAFVLIRTLQACGAYGLRGMVEQKPLFIQSIPGALDNINYILSNLDIPVPIEHLRKTLIELNKNTVLQEYINKSKMKLTIQSFSYKRGIPYDNTGNGGGFVFDCRCILNPGRFEEYKLLNGKDEKVQQFFSEKANKEVSLFLNNAISMVNLAIDSYTERGFNHLAVSFGCTGGQHRSVYFAEKLAEYLKSNSNCIIEVKHLEQE
jgi:aminoglycoside/choline kinase family phosphotransferase